jgi:hypothetical protein
MFVISKYKLVLAKRLNNIVSGYAPEGFRVECSPCTQCLINCEYTLRMLYLELLVSSNVSYILPPASSHILLHTSHQTYALFCCL